MATYSAARRRNVSPVSSTLHVVVRDVDCSALSPTPEDGEFVTQEGTRNSAAVYFGVAGAVTCTAAEVSSLKMVWESALHTDRQALGHRRVPVLMHHGIEVECKLYNLIESDVFAVGSYVTVAQADASVVSSDDRLVLQVVTPNAGAQAGWAVGYVTKIPESFGPDKAVTVYLYDKPMWVTVPAEGV